MKLYELVKEMEDLVALSECGEIPEEAIRDTLEGLQGEINEKAEQIALTVKQLVAEAAAIKQEEQRLAERRKAKENAAESIKRYLSEMLLKAGIGKIDTARAAITFRSSKAVEIEDESSFIAWAQENADQYLTFSAPKISKSAVKEALASGIEVRWAHIEEKQNIQIK